MTTGKLSLTFKREFQNNYRHFIPELIKKHGDAFKLQGPQFNLHFITNPNYIKYIMYDNYEAYNTAFSGNKVIDALAGLVLKNHELWQCEKKVLNPLFTNTHLVKYSKILTDTISEHLDKWESHLEKQTPLNLDHALASITLDNLKKCYFGNTPLNIEKVKECIKEVFYLMDAYEKSMTKLEWKFPTPTLRRYNQMIREMENINDDIVKYCLSDNAPKDNIIRVLSETQLPEKFSKQLEKYLRIKAFGFLLAGYESIGTTLNWACVYLSLYPIYAQKIREELAKIGQRELTVNDLDSLVYTRAVIMEILRLQPPTPFATRVAIKDDMYESYKIKANDMILVPIFYMHRLTQYWTNPEGFDPDRFINPLDERLKYVYLPFNVGPHQCLGRMFALTEGILTLAMIVQRYNLSIVPNTILKREKSIVLNQLRYDLCVNLSKA